MPEKDFSATTDADLAAHLARKRESLDKANAGVAAADREVEEQVSLLASAELLGAASSQIATLRAAHEAAMSRRAGRRGARASVQHALDAVLAEQAQRAARGAEAEAVAAREALTLHVQSMARVALEASKAMTALRTTLRERAQACRTLDNIERKAQGTKPVQHVLTLDEYADRVQLEMASPGLAEVVQVLSDYEAGQLGAQITQRTAAAARERVTNIAQQGLAG